PPRGRADAKACRPGTGDICPAHAPSALDRAHRTRPSKLSAAASDCRTTAVTRRTHPLDRIPMRKTVLALSLAAAALPDIAAQPLQLGTTETCQLAASARSSDRGGRSHDYSLRLQQGQLGAVTVKSEDFDPVVIVFRPDGDQL